MPSPEIKIINNNDETQSPPEVRDLMHEPVHNTEATRQRVDQLISLEKAENRNLPYSNISGVIQEHEKNQVVDAYKTIDGICELNNPETAEKFNPNHARALYEYLFPNPDEAESWEDDILPRLDEMRRIEQNDKLQEKYGDSRFHAIAAYKNKDTVGYTQFSTMPLANKQVVVFWQYGGVADRQFMEQQYGKKDNYRQNGIGRAFYAARHAIAAEDAKEMGYENGVAGTILEAEMIGQGDNPDDIRYTKKRLHIHRQLGAKAIMLRMEDGSLVTAHMQPRLSEGSNPIQLMMMFRPLNYDKNKLHDEEPMDKALAESLVMSYIDNFDREGFDSNDVQEARSILLERFSKAKEVVLLPPEKIPTITEMARHDDLLKAQVERDYGSIEEQEKKINEALNQPANINARTLGM